MQRFLFFVILFSTFISFQSCQPEEEKPLYVTYATFDEIEPIFNRQSDSTYVINFWATWCKPCVEELPYFEELNQNYSKEKVKVVLVSLDFEKVFNTSNF